MKSHSLTLFAAFLFFFASFGEKSLAQNSVNPQVTVSGEVANPHTLTLEVLKNMPMTEVEAIDKDGMAHTFQGVLILDILKKSGVGFGLDLKGKNQAKYLLVEAADGHKVVFSLPEIDPDFSAKKALLAYYRDGKALKAGIGPFRIVVPEEKLHARWVREVISFKIQTVK